MELQVIYSEGNYDNSTGKDGIDCVKKAISTHCFLSLRDFILKNPKLTPTLEIHELETKTEWMTTYRFEIFMTFKQEENPSIYAPRRT